MDAYRRVTVLAPACRLDVALPADLAVAELVPMVRELLGEPVPAAGRAPVPWRLDGAAGAPLPPGATLGQLGVHDGELLRIGPAVAPPPPPRCDDLPEALAAAVEAGARAGDDRVLPLTVLVAVTAASALLAGVRGGGLLLSTAGVVVGFGAAIGAPVVASRVRGRGVAAAGTASAATGLAAVAASVQGPAAGPATGMAAGLAAAGPAAEPAAAGLAAAGQAAGARAAAGRVSGAGAAARAAVGARAAADPAPATGSEDRSGSLLAALSALPPAAAAGWLLAPGSSIAAALGAALLLALSAAMGQAVVRVVAPVLTAAFLVGATTALSCAVLLLTRGTPASAGAVCAAVGVLVAPLLPRLALRLAGLPGPEDPPPDLELRADLARRHLAGLVLGTALVTTGGGVLAATAPGPWGPLLAPAVCVVLLLRARGFAEPLPGRALQVAGLLGLCGAAAAGTLAAPAPIRLLAALATLTALLVVLALHPRPRRPGPVGRRTLDLAELVLTASCVPLAAAALGLFALVRGW